MRCVWHLVYINSPQITKRSHSAPLKRGPNVQDCIHRPRTLQHPVRPADGLHRPPADRERPHLRAQRRPAPFRSLRPLRRSAGYAFRFDTFRLPPRLKGPGFPGPLFLRVRQASRMSASSATNQPELCFHITIHLQSWHIAYQNTSKRSELETGAIRRMGAGVAAPRRPERFDRLSRKGRCVSPPFRLIRKTRMLRGQVGLTIIAATITCNAARLNLTI